MLVHCIWGFHNFGCIDIVRNKAAHFYLGVHKFAPNLGINSEIGWVSREAYRKVDMIRFWKILQCTSEKRLLKKVFKWDKRLSKKSWSYEMKTVRNDLNMLPNLMKIYV